MDRPDLHGNEYLPFLLDACCETAKDLRLARKLRANEVPVQAPTSRHWDKSHLHLDP